MNSQVFIRFSVFAGVFLLMLILELIIPERKAVHSRIQRWPGNLLILALGNLIGLLLIPVLPYTAAVFAESAGWGLAGTDLPLLFQVIITVLLLDVWVYLQHLLFHRLPVLRALHRMHHTDTHIDVSSALRFHPIEIIISILYKSALVLALGLNPLGILTFEILLNAAAMFNHSNIRISDRVEGILRFLIVTPLFHRIHHSRIKDERNSNYGFFLSIWDRLFSTWTEEAEGDAKLFSVGITGYDDAAVHRIDKLLIDPFTRRQRRES